MKRLALLCLAATLAAAPWPSRAAPPPGEVAAVATHVVTTTTRTLRTVPMKRVITSAEGWARVTDGLEGAPPAPDFGRHVVLLVVADVTGGATSRLGPMRLRGDGSLHVVLEREEPARIETNPVPTLLCFFVVLPPFEGGVHLEHRTLLGIEGSGYVQRPSPPDPADRDPERLPSLAPDLQLTYVMKDGSTPPERASLRIETRFERQGLTGRVTTLDFPRAGVRSPFPRFRDGVRYVLAAHAPGLRSAAPLVLDGLPPDGPDGNPAPIEHRFVLEPVVEPARGSR